MPGPPSPPAHWLNRLARALGPTGPPRQLGGAAWMVEAGGRTVVAKLGPEAKGVNIGDRRIVFPWLGCVAPN